MYSSVNIKARVNILHILSQVKSLFLITSNLFFCIVSLVKALLLKMLKCSKDPVGVENKTVKNIAGVVLVQLGGDQKCTFERYRIVTPDYQ